MEPALASSESSASGGALKYSRRSPGRVVRRIRPEPARSLAVPLIAPRLPGRAAAMSAAVCSTGSEIRSQPHIRPAIGVMPLEARNWPISSTNRLSPGVTAPRYALPNVHAILNVDEDAAEFGPSDADRMPDRLHLEERRDPLRSLRAPVVEPVEPGVGHPRRPPRHALDVLRRGLLRAHAQRVGDAPHVDRVDVDVRGEHGDEVPLEPRPGVHDACRRA